LKFTNPRANHSLREPGDEEMETMRTTSARARAAIGYSLVWLIAGGGLVGAVVIFIIAKLLGH
jgi:hypothetical protein